MEKKMQKPEDLIQEARELRKELILLTRRSIIVEKKLQELNLLAEKTPKEIQIPSINLSKEEEMNLEMMIASDLQKLGVPANLLGYQYLKEALLMVLKEPEYLHRVVKGLYPALAEVFNTRPPRVERAIRHAIEVSFDKTKHEMLFEHQDQKPTNTEFVAALAEYIKFYQLNKI